MDSSKIFHGCLVDLLIDFGEFTKQVFKLSRILFFYLLLAMVKYRGRFKYIIFIGATGQVLKLSWILCQRFIRDGYVSGRAFLVDFK